jgi:hypothetical protein
MKHRIEKRRWRARAPKRFASKEAAERPPGFGVRARQRRFGPATGMAVKWLGLPCLLVRDRRAKLG